MADLLGSMTLITSSRLKPCGLRSPRSVVSVCLAPCPQNPHGAGSGGPPPNQPTPGLVVPHPRTAKRSAERRQRANARAAVMQIAKSIQT